MRSSGDQVLSCGNKTLSFLFVLLVGLVAGTISALSAPVRRSC